VTLRLRRADAGDSHGLWLWANDPGSRAGSGNRPPIAWEEHLAWLGERLLSPDALIFIAIGDGGRPVGTIRFETEDGWGRARLSYLVAPEARGTGLGRPLLLAGLAELRAHAAGGVVEATVYPENAPSLRLFRSLGWRERREADGRRVFEGRAEETVCRS
jgi:RimJ/RimL family protein N-acetyltransferase